MVDVVEQVSKVYVYWACPLQVAYPPSPYVTILNWRPSTKILQSLSTAPPPTLHCTSCGRQSLHHLLLREALWRFSQRFHSRSLRRTYPSPRPTPLTATYTSVRREPTDSIGDRFLQPLPARALSTSPHHRCCIYTQGTLQPAASSTPFSNARPRHQSAGHLPTETKFGSFPSQQQQQE